MQYLTVSIASPISWPCVDTTSDVPDSVNHRARGAPQDFGEFHRTGAASFLGRRIGARELGSVGDPISHVSTRDRTRQLKGRH